MSYQDRVLWSEGMFLTPHHMQQAERHRVYELRKRIANLCRFDWGLGQLKIDHDALTGGEVRIAACQAVMPDGLLVDVPDHDAAPESRNLRDFFEPHTTCLGVYLAVPTAVAGAVAADPGDRGADDADRPQRTRYRGEFLTVTDENTDGREREIQVARKHLRLLFDGESLDGHVTLKIFAVRRDASGQFALDPKFLPAAYCLSASENMLPFLRRLIANLASRRDTLAAQRRKTGSSLARFAPSEAATFWLLHTISVHLPVLRHMDAHPSTHPETLYLELLRMAGALTSFSEDVTTDDLKYQHHDQGRTFADLEAMLGQLLETVIPQRYKTIELRPTSKSIFTGSLTDDGLLEAAEFYLAVRSDVGEDKVIKELPIKAKLSSEERLRSLITAAVRGILIRHLPNPPTDIFEPGRTYFQLEKTGDHWAAVCQDQTLSVYVPPEFTGIQVELMAVSE